MALGSTGFEALGQTVTEPEEASLDVGTTEITGGSTGQVLYDNAGTLGEYNKIQLTAQINVFSSILSGAVPASGGGTTNFLRADGTFASPSASSFANPTASVGLAAVNGVATTGMRSDAAPVLSQSIIPTWTGAHSWTGSVPQITLGVNSGNGGQINISGSTSGTVSVKVVPAAGTFNFNLPITAGTANQVLTSQAGGTTAMTWTTLATSATTDTTNAANISSGTLPAGRLPALTGDITTTVGTVATTLATVNANVGTFQGIAVNAKGLVTAATNQNYLTGNQTITLSGDITGSGTTAITATAGATVLKPGTTNTITIGYTITPFNGGTVSSGTFTPSAANGNYQFYTNNGAHTFANPAADSAIDILITNGASAGAITFSTFTVGTTGDALTTTNTNKFIVSVRRINSISTYLIKALQ